MVPASGVKSRPIDRCRNFLKRGYVLQIGKTLVSLDLIEKYFVCDLEACLGACCVEGDEGAPLSEEESSEIKHVLDKVEPYMTPGGMREVRENGVDYLDREGDRVTALVNGCECAFTCREPGGLCLCSLEKARRAGLIDKNVKPISCRLYPVRVKEYEGFIAVNLHRWKICRPAETNGKRLGVRAYEFLKEPLVARFGEEWYAELELAAREWLKQKEASDADD